MRIDDEEGEGECSGGEGIENLFMMSNPWRRTGEGGRRRSQYSMFVVSGSSSGEDLMFCI